MDAEEFRVYGKELVDYIADYVSNIRDRPVVPDVKPGYLKEALPTEAPEKSESFKDVMEDVEKHVMPGVTQWHHPNFLAYYPTATSFPSICGDMLSSAIACIGFSWMSSPSCTELEVIVLDWLVKAMDLPEHFLSTSPGHGGGVIQATASDSTHLAAVAARARYTSSSPDGTSGSSEKDPRSLVAYTSHEGHSSVERAFRLALLQIRKIRTNEAKQMDAVDLRRQILEDSQNGLTPCIVVATSGTTGSCAFDDLEVVGKVCSELDVYLHVDSAYAGSMMICPEYRHLFRGVQFADSFNFNAHKLLLTNFDCSPMWFKDSSTIIKAFNVDPVYLQGLRGDMPDYRHWQVPLGRRFRSLKLWFVLRMFGLEKLREVLRQHNHLGKVFHDLIYADKRFEVVAPRTLGLVCFRLKNDNKKTELLYQKLNEDKRIFLVTSKFHENEEVLFLRVVPCSTAATEKDMEFAYQVISQLTESL